MRPLMDWLAVHPLRDDPEAPLWPSLAPNRNFQSLTYPYFKHIVKRIAARAGYKKEFWPYLLRHSRLTFMADKLTESRLDEFAGWTLGSRMPRRYVHFSGRDLDANILGIYGIKPREEVSGSLLKPKDCPRCNAEIAPEVKRCPRCGLVVDQVLAAKHEQSRLKREEDLIRRIERLEREYAAAQAQGGHREAPSSPRLGTS
jgi:ribosomal protein L40E